MDGKRGDPEFLRRVASEMRSRRNLSGAMELEKRARELEEEDRMDCYQYGRKP